jgi:PBP1b-binding outer membrane lipoprotein LpoB
MKMKSNRLLISVIALLITGCATSLAPSENFNDWTNSALHRQYPEQRGSEVGTQTTPSSLAQAPGKESIHP